MELFLRPQLQPGGEHSPLSRFCASSIASDGQWDRWIIGATVISVLLKLTIAYNTLGTNDAVSFYIFARSLRDHGLEWTYLRGAEWLPAGPIFNHPPLTAYYLQVIEKFAGSPTLQSIGITFPFLLRVPGIIADAVVVIALLWLTRRYPSYRVPHCALLLLALSPVSLMVSGFHGNTDSVMVMFLVLATIACCQTRAAVSGLFLALSCQIKVIPLLFLPIFLLFWVGRRGAIRFLLSFLVICSLLWSQPLIKFPGLFIRNVLGYGSFWGTWGISYWLRLTQLPAFSRVSFMNLSQPQIIVAALLKIAIVAAILTLAWRRRTVDGPNVLKSIGYGWLIFFALSPGVCPQYMVWLAPFVLFISPTFYGCLTAASGLYLFCFYNITAHGLPWFLAISKNNLTDACAPWALWPWITILIGLALFWHKAAAANPCLRLFSFNKIAAIMA